MDAALRGMVGLLGATAPPQAGQLSPPSPAARFPHWDGDASQAAAEAPQQLHQAATQWYGGHRAAAGLIDRGGHVVVAGRTALQGVCAEWERDKAATAPFGSTPQAQAALAAAGQLRLNEASQIISETRCHLFLQRTHPPVS